jgi:hypothetical protein
MIGPFCGVLLLLHTFVNILFVRFIPLYELALSLGAVGTLGFVVAYFSQHAVRQFSLNLAMGSVLVLLFLSSYTGVGWENPIVTAVLDTSFRFIDSQAYELVQESIVEGTISQAHAQAYRECKVFAGAGRY